MVIDRGTIRYRCRPFLDDLSLPPTLSHSPPASDAPFPPQYYSFCFYSWVFSIAYIRFPFPTTTPHPLFMYALLVSNTLASAPDPTPPPLDSPTIASLTPPTIPPPFLSPPPPGVSWWRSMTSLVYEAVHETGALTM